MRIILALCASMLLASASTAVRSEHDTSQPASRPIEDVPGRLLVQGGAALALSELDGILKLHGARRIDAIERLNVHIVELPAQASSVATQAVAQALRRNPRIRAAEIDRRLPPALTPTDPGYGNAWHLPKIGSPGAWDYSSGNGVVVAVLDTGVDATHPDLAANLVAGYNAYDGNTNSSDVHGHGTRVAGTVAMVAHNSVGGVGVAYGARIMPIRVADAQGYAYYSTLAKGITWAADHGARVASMSFSGVCGSSTLMNAAQYMRSKGGVVVGSAGNSGVEEAQTPNDAITCVSATDSADLKASWSSYGAYVDVAAPGVSIYTSSMGGGYSYVSGTSFSAPITAAVYALMMAANPELTPSELDAALFSTALDLGAAGKDTRFGHGRVQAAAAVAQVTESPPDTQAPSVSITSPAPGAQVKGVVSVQVLASDNVKVARAELYAAGKLVGTDQAAPYSFSWNSAAHADGQVRLEAKAFDVAGNPAGSQITVNVANATGGTPPAPPAPGAANVALASAGAVASASSGVRRFPVSEVNDGERTGVRWDDGGGWRDATQATWPDWVQITLPAAKSIDRVVLYSLQDNYSAGVEPGDTLTFSRYGIVDFTVEGWNGSAWVRLATVSGNRLVKRSVSFPAFTTQRLRVNVNQALRNWSRIIEIEAWGR